MLTLYDFLGFKAIITRALCRLITVRSYEMLSNEPSCSAKRPSLSVGQSVTCDISQLDIFRVLPENYRLNCGGKLESVSVSAKDVMLVWCHYYS